ncbi:cobyrinate a,c-diamide synthase [Paraliomyxa miuraensis]|uniref:cobyrinate a,c-diamide synthase n=1 Tax=Paraliomyxa miuraensis TaxID=376150 RepID=UPI00224E25CF|nr:cobyrinate a,c-diamide synthase [Paraliomyxa miuraensis]MCX4246374.1 cobyrinate a,c-diamide synthase [Paraliomyxa miuraensis]
MASDSHRPGFIIGATHSGAGKTTASIIVMAMLREHGYRVQPFKIGPDFIDPQYHRAATGANSVNLDAWMLGEETIASVYREHSQRSDVAVVEAMGALFDGENGTQDRGSAAHLARLLRLPVILVLDIWGMTRSTAAVVQGFESFDPRVEIRALLFNRAGSVKHFEMVRDAMPARLRPKIIGYLPASAKLTMPERHLGLVTMHENTRADRLVEEMVAQVRDTIDLPRLCTLFGIERRELPSPTKRRSPAGTVRIGVADDQAFCFYYPDNLERLEAAGAELVRFSPIEDDAPPEGISGLYFGGGYPEHFATALSNNRSMRTALRDALAAGLPAYAECGGLIYFGRSLIDFEGARHEMVGAVPVDTQMDREYLAIRYVELTTRVGTPFGPAGLRVRGHEFHQSRIVADDTDVAAYAGVDSAGQPLEAGYSNSTILAGYPHLHFASNPEIAVNFVAACRRFQERTREGLASTEGQ